MFCFVLLCRKSATISEVAPAFTPQKAKFKEQPLGAGACVLFIHSSAKLLRLEKSPKKCFNNGKLCLCKFDRYSQPIVKHYRLPEVMQN